MRIKHKYKALILIFIAFFFCLKANGQSLFNVQNGAKVRFANNSLVKINGDITINSGATLNIGQNAIIKLIGNWFNDGIQNCGSGTQVYFIGDADSVLIGGNGTTYQFSSIIIEKDDKSYLVELNAPITVPNGFLTLTQGTFKIAGTNGLTNNFFALYQINENSAFILDNPNVTITGENSNFILSGTLNINQGIFYIGTGISEHSLLYQSAAIPPTLEISGGELHINSRLARLNDTDSIRFIQTGGTIFLGKTAVSTAANRGMFDISSGSTFNVSGGTIELQRPSTTFEDYFVQPTTSNVTGGILQFNSQDGVNKSFTVNSTASIGVFSILANNNPDVTLSANTNVLGNINLNGSGADRLKMNNFSLSLGGNWTNNFANSNSFNQGNQPVIFTGAAVQKIQGTQTPVFNHLSINKTDGKVEQELSTTINGNLRLLSDTAIFDMKDNDLVIGLNGKIYAGTGTEEDIDYFSSTKCVLNTNTDTLTGSKLIKYLSPATSLPVELYFPVTTPGVYTANLISFFAAGATFGANPYIAVRNLPFEHPAVEITNRSLQKYWVIETQDLTVADNGATVEFYYDASEIEGNEGNWRVLYFAPSWNDPEGYWRIDPGETDDIVEFNQKLFYSVQVDEIAGDWTAGEPDVAYGQYFARADGDYNDPETWSKQGFNGDPSPTAPNKRSDRVRIQDHNVTVTEQPPPAQIISVENGTEGRASGKLYIDNGYYLTGDTLKLEQNATLGISHENGITLAPVDDGNVRTDYRFYNTGAIYEYNGENEQTLGNGLPSTIKALVVTKPNADTLILTQNISITDSLIINNGTLDMGASTINGNSSGRTFKMLGGEFIIRSAFPNNYTAPSLSDGRITFNGNGSVTIPSSGSSPGIFQYNDLKITGSNRSGNVTFQSLGEIRIKNTLDISELTFANNSFKFFTNGSTVRFNKSGGVQDIPCRPAAPADSICFLEYYNLTLDSAGTKRLSASGTPVFKVTNNLRIDNNASFTAFNADLAANYNLEIHGNWTNQIGTFNPGSGTVIFHSPVATVSTFINSRDTTDNPFNNLIFTGDGIVTANENLKVTGNLTINTGTTLNLTNKFISIYGNWQNYDGLFDYGTSTVQFNSTSTQSITRNVGNIQFYNLNLNNPNNVDASGIGASGNGIIVNNNLNLNAGNLITHSGSNYRFATVIGAITRTGNGYIDGELRRNVATGASSSFFPVGFNKVYTPVTIDLTGTGGVAGLLSVLSDTLTTSTSPISWTDAIPSNIAPTGSMISPERHIARQFLVTVPSGSSFQLGVNRKYNSSFNFYTSDLRNGTDANIVDFRTLSGANWIGPYQYSTFPFIQTRTSNSITINQNVDFGSFLIGEPGTLIFYTRSSGNWNCDTCWSAQGYGMNSAGTYPGGTGNNNYKAYIGDGDSINLVSNVTVNTTGGNTGLIQIDSSGILMCENFVISGTGNFYLANEGTLGIGNANGIRQTGNFGNIQTTGRDFNFNTHNRGRFIYTGSLNQTQANEGLPAIIAKLNINKASNTLTLNRAVTIEDGIYIQSGTLTQGAALTINGNWENYGTYNNNNQLVDFNGPVRDTIKANSAQTFHQLRLMKSGGNLFTNQPIIINNLLQFRMDNKAVLVAQEPGTYVQINSGATLTRSDSGHVYGELRKQVNNNNTTATWEVGSDSLHGYRPYVLTLSGYSGTAGLLAVRLFDDIQPQYSSIPLAGSIDPGWLVYKYWRLTRPSGSSFQLGTRTSNVNLTFLNPDDLRNGAVPGCFDIDFWNGSQWNILNKNSVASNYEANSNCSNRPLGSYNYSGSATTVQVNSIASALMGTGTIGSDVFLGDFITGRAVEIPTTTFWSRQDGNWFDLNTWSTEGYDGDPATRVPREFFDIAYIGNGKHVTLDKSIGNGYRSDVTWDALKYAALRTINLESQGKLSLGTNFVYCFGFQMKDGSTLEVGSLDGIINRGSSPITTGNLWTITYSFFDETDDNNFIYTAEGYNSAFTPQSEGGVTPPRATNNSAEWIERVQLGDIDNTSGRDIAPQSGYQFFPSDQTTLIAGQSYSITLTPGFSGSSINQRWRVWIDYNFSGDFTNNTTERMVDLSGSASAQTANFTVPAGAMPGTTRMRIRMWRASESTGLNPTGNNTRGEVEDYSVKIVNPNYAALTQSTGTGLPNYFSSLNINTNRAGDAVTLSKNINTNDFLQISKGTFNAGSYTIGINGDLINNVSNGFNAQTSTVIISGFDKDTVRGDYPITLNKLKINKQYTSEKVYFETDITANGNFEMETDNNIVLKKEKTITLETGSNLTPVAGSFSQNRMIEVDGTATVNNIVKKFGQIEVLPPPGTYCTASLSGTNRWLTNVQVNSWNNPSGASPYSDFTSLTGPVISVGSNSITLTHNGGNQSRFAAWIDYNQDGDFADANERLFQTGNLNASHTTTFNVLAAVYNGTTRMRVSVKRNANQNVNGCDTVSTDGEYEDYTITITGATDKPGLANFTFPLGTDGQYHPADLAFRVSATSTPTVSLGLRNYKHPARLTDNSLDRFWSFSSSGFNGTVTIDSLKMRYYDSNISGDLQRYIPGRHKTPGGWEINLGDNPLAKVPGADSLIITIKNDGSGINGDYTAGEPLIYFPGRVFYSINTGEWNNKFNWSNDPDAKHTGPAASYFPGMLFEDDTVNIDGHIITFKDSINISLDSIRIGGTNPVGGQGRLIFGATPLAKSLTVRQMFLDEDGLVTGLTPGGRADTIKIRKNLRNETTAPMVLRNDLDNSTTLKFIGTGNSNILGNGNWEQLGNLVLAKENGLNDTLSILSEKYYDAVDSTQSFKFNFWSGIFLNEIDKEFTLSTANETNEMGTNSGIDSRDGSIISQAGLTTNMNTSINIDGGDLIIGDEANEHLLYKTGTSLSISSGELRVAGGLSRALSNSVMDFTLTNGEVKVNTEGNTEQIGFDLSNAGSSFSMTNGRIIIANKAGTTPLQFDYRVNAQGGTGMEGGILQCGDTTLTPDGTLIKIGGNLPVYSLHFANDPSRTATTQITEEVFNIKGNWCNDFNHLFNLSGNTVYLGGNLSNYGTFSAVPSVATSSPWQIVLNGTNGQHLLSNDDVLELYNLRIDKPGGQVFLSDTGNSNLLIRNTLEFSTDNLAYISAPVEEDKYVEISPIDGVSNPQILRNGKGHIHGRLYWYIGSGIQNVYYPIGDDDIDIYRPATFSTVGDDNSPGLLGIINHNFDHPDILDAGVDTSTNVQSYWNLYPKDVDGFGLAIGRNYSLKLQFLNPGDIRNSVSPLFFEQRMYTPPCPDPPDACDGSGSWVEINTPARTDSTSSSLNNTVFGDFVIGFPSGVTFYSYKNGDWNEKNTWSWDGYTGPQNVPTRIPNEQYDIVRVGNGKTVTVPDGFIPRIRSVFVEKYNGLPGFLQINGNLNYIGGNSFSLADSCTLGIQHLNGIAPETDPTRGAIQTSIRNYGVSRYLFNSSYGSQNTGYGMPDSIKAIIVDNPSTPTNSVFISHSAGGPGLRILDSIYIRQGELQSGNRTISLYGTMLIDSINFNNNVNYARFGPLEGIFTFAGSNNKYIVLKNRIGVSFHNLNILGGNIFAIDSNSVANDTSNVKIKNTLNFTGPGLFTLEQGSRPVNLVIESSLTNRITGAASDRFIRTSPNSGYLKRRVATGNTYSFPVGSLDIGGTTNLYAPASFEAGASGSAGWIAVRTSKGEQISGAHKMISSNPNAIFLRRYWTIDSVTTTINGKWNFTYNNADLLAPADENNFTKTGRWRPVKEQTPGSWAHPFTTLTINTGTNTFSTDANFSYDGFIGDWLMGNDYAFRRIFFSKQSGNWNDPNTWTFITTHDGPIAGAGLWPDSEQDSVVIGGKDGLKHIVNLNISESYIDGVALGAIHPGTLALPGEHSLTGKYFQMFDYSTLQIGSSLGINPSDTARGNIKSTIAIEFPEMGIYEYIGTSNQSIGAALPSNVYRLKINNTGGEDDNIVTLTRNIFVRDSLTIDSGVFNLQTNFATGSDTAHFSVLSDARLRIAGNNTLLTSLNGYLGYNFDVNSYTEFFGAEQIISNFPAMLVRTVGLGNVITSEAGFKRVNDTFKVRGNIWINNASTLYIAGPQLLQVSKNVVNSSVINNNGIIEIGE